MSICKDVKTKISHTLLVLALMEVNLLENSLVLVSKVQQICGFWARQNLGL